MDGDMESSASSSDAPRAYYSQLGRMRMLAGDPALDFANTLHWRDGQLVDFVPDYAELVRWSVPAGHLSAQEAQAVLAAAEGSAAKARATHQAAIDLRSAWRARLARLTRPLAPTEVPAADAPSLEALLRKALGPSRLVVFDAADRPLDPDERIALPLVRIALTVASLSFVPAARRLGRCEGDPCGGFFLDTSRAKPRRWCSMDTCGNRAKMRAFRSRMAVGDAEGPARHR
jgi:predicted RNA-binding Zn ribbon-like protein